MSKELSFDNMPNTLDPNELPFVLGWGTDRRRSLRLESGIYRRRADMFSMELLVAKTVRTRAFGWLARSECLVVASLGPMFNDWWPLLTSSPIDPARPVLSAGVLGTAVTMSREDVHLPLTVFMEPEAKSLLVFTTLDGGFTAQNLLLSRYMAPPVIKAALLGIYEYSTLANPVPDMNIVQSGIPKPLGGVVAAAKAIADLIDWQPSFNL